MSFAAAVITTIDLTALDGFILGLDARVQAVVAAFADLIVKRAQDMVPVDTGALRDSITAHLTEWAAEITAGEGLDYAIYVEFGSVKAPAHPFLRPAVEQYTAEFIAAVQAAVGG